MPAPLPPHDRRRGTHATGFIAHSRAECDALFVRGHGFGAASDAHPRRWRVDGASDEHAAADRAPTTGASREGAPAANAPQRWIMAELGFGAGHAFLCAWAAMRAHGGPTAQMDWVGIDDAPLDVEALRAAVRADPSMAALVPLADELAAAWPPRTPGVHRRALEGGRLRLTLVWGDPLEFLPSMPFLADAWNVHAAAPAAATTPAAPPLTNASNAADALLEQVALHARVGCTVAVTDASPEVRAALQRCGFALEPQAIVPGTAACTHGLLRQPLQEYSRGARRPLPPWFAQPAPSHARVAVVVGAGLAGAAAARALAERGLRVHVLDALGAAQGGSSAPRAILAPHIASWQSPQTRLVAHAFLHARAALERLGAPLEACGLLRPLRMGEEWGHELALAEWGWPPELLRVIDPQAASALAGLALEGAPERGAVYIPLAATTHPRTTVEHLLQHEAITLHECVRVDAIRRVDGGWTLLASGAGVPGIPAPMLTRAPLVIIATAGAWTPRFSSDESFNIDHSGALAAAALPETPLDQTRGQLSFFCIDDGVDAVHPRTIVAEGGFVTPPADGSVCVGATYERGVERIETTARDDALNLVTLERLLPTLAAPGRKLERAAAWSGLRASVNDHCPVVGAVPDSPAFRAAFAPLRDGPHAAPWPAAPTLPGLFVTLAHGSRGTSTAMLCGELLADIVVGGVRCVPDSLLPAVLPQRFLVRTLRSAAAPM